MTKNYNEEKLKLFIKRYVRTYLYIFQVLTNYTRYYIFDNFIKTPTYNIYDEGILLVHNHKLLSIIVITNQSDEVRNTEELLNSFN